MYFLAVCQQTFYSIMSEVPGVSGIVPLEIDHSAGHALFHRSIRLICNYRSQISKRRK